MVVGIDSQHLEAREVMPVPAFPIAEPRLMHGILSSLPRTLPNAVPTCARLRLFGRAANSTTFQQSRGLRATIMAGPRISPMETCSAYMCHSTAGFTGPNGHGDFTLAYDLANLAPMDSRTLH